MEKIFGETKWEHSINERIRFSSIETLTGKKIGYYQNLTGINVNDVYATVDRKGAVRGFSANFEQVKFVQVLCGKAHIVIESLDKIIFDEIIDNSHPPIIVYAGQFFGYKALEENTVLNFIVSGKYDPEQESVVNPKSFGNPLNVDENCIVNESEMNADIYEFRKKDF